MDSRSVYLAILMVSLVGLALNVASAAGTGQDAGDMCADFTEAAECNNCCHSMNRKLVGDLALSGSVNTCVCMRRRRRLALSQIGKAIKKPILAARRQLKNMRETRRQRKSTTIQIQQ